MPFILLVSLLIATPSPSESDGPLSWSPDGKWLAYVQEVRPRPRSLEAGWLFGTAPAEVGILAGSGRPTSYRLWVSRPETGESVLMDEASRPLSAPSWNRDGTGLAYLRIVKGSDGANSWEVVVQDAPDHRRVVRSEPFDGGVPVRIGGLVPGWSPDGKLIAVRPPGQKGIQIVRADTGRVVRTLETAIKSEWSPLDNRLSYVTAAPQAGLWVLDGVMATPRQLAVLSTEVDILPAPIWGRDAQSIMILRRTTLNLVPGGANRGESAFQVVRYRVDGTGIEPAADLVHDALGKEGAVLGVSFVVSPSRDDAFLATVSTGQLTSQLTWAGGRYDVSKKRFNPFDEESLLGDLAASPAGQWLALRVGTQSSWSAPAICDVEEESLILLAPDDSARQEWLSRILDVMIPLLRHHVPVAVLADGTEAQRPSLLPAPGEIEPGDPIAGRLKRLAKMGLKLIGPVAVESDETRLAFCYLAGDDTGATRTIDRMMSRADGPESRFRLLSIQAQILVMQREFDRAKPLIEYLRSASNPRIFEIEELPQGHRLVRTVNARSLWPRFLEERIKALKNPIVEDSPDLVPRGALNFENQIVPQPPAVPAPVRFRP
jgi:hypothetical protein